MMIGDKSLKPEEKLTRVYPQKIYLVILLVKSMMITSESQD